MPTYDGIGSSITHRVEVVGDSLFQDVDGGTLSTKVPVQIFSNYYASPGSVDSSRQLRFRVQPDGESNVSNSYVTDMGVKGADGSNYFFITAPQNTSNVGDQNTFVISTTSNVGIGTTNPTSTLHVVGNELITGTLTASNIVGGSPLTITSDQNLQVNSNLTVGTSNLFVDTSTGRVGIGTDDPKTKLHVSHDLHLQASSENWNSTAGPGLYLRYSTNSGQDEGYIQAIDRSTGTKKPMVLEASQFYFNGGNVGIGTDSPVDNFAVFKNTLLSSNVEDSTYAVFGNQYSSGDVLNVVSFGDVRICCDANNASTGKKISFITNGGTNYDSGTVGGGSELMTILDTGNVGIGTASPSYKLHVAGDIYSSGIGRFTTPTVGDNVTTDGIVIYCPTGAQDSFHGINFYNTNQSFSMAAIRARVGGGYNDSSLMFYTSANQGTPTEKMRITSGGNIVQNSTNGVSYFGQEASTGANGKLQVWAGTTGLAIDGASFRATSDGNHIINFMSSGGGLRGKIAGTGSGSVSYVTSSDIRLKENIVDMSSMLDLIMNMRAREFDWKEDKIHSYGFIAQEVFELMPWMRPNIENYCGCDADCDRPCYTDGKEYIYGLDYGSFTPYIIKAFQEYKIKTDAKIESLEARIEALENSS